ncbi:MAG: adenosylcobinamide-GDP ribazoletransferase [Candidatus Kuenenia sp.]|nr:adenosylcobinamide-GDP ribazoletransferase [Candidatus Kuenenia hertensis]
MWALKFLTIIPSKTESGELPGKNNYIVCWFPIIGIIIGIILSIVYILCQYVFPYYITNVLILVAYVLITGALHLDGFADTCDGIFGGWNKEKRLEIMKDSHIGSYGVVGLIFILGLKYVCLLHIGNYSGSLGVKEVSTVLLLKFNALNSINISPETMTKIIVLCLMPAVGRWTQVFAAGISDYARDTSGTGCFIVKGTTRKHVLFASIIPLVLMLYLFRLKGLAVCAIIVVLTLFIIWYIKRKIGGMTGDTLGALNEVAEIIFLVTLIVVF